MKEEKRYEQLFHAYAHPTRAGGAGDYLRRLQNEAGGNSRYRSTFYNLHRANIMNRVLDIRLQHNIKIWSKMHGRNCGAIERYQNQLFERICKMIPPENPNESESEILVPVPETCFQVKEMKLAPHQTNRKVSHYRLPKIVGMNNEKELTDDDKSGVVEKSSWNNEQGLNVRQDNRDQRQRKLSKNNFNEKEYSKSWNKSQKEKSKAHRNEQMKTKNENKTEGSSWNKDQKSKDQYEQKQDGQQNVQNQIVSEFRKWEKKNSDEKLKGRLSKSTSKSSLYEEQQTQQQQRQNRWRKLLEQRKIFSTSKDYTINFNLVKTFTNNLVKADLNTSEVTLVKKSYANDVKENKTVLKTKYM